VTAFLRRIYASYTPRRISQCYSDTVDSGTEGLHPGVAIGSPRSAMLSAEAWERVREMVGGLDILREPRAHQPGGTDLNLGPG
jgi:hypothetical protein